MSHIDQQEPMVRCALNIGRCICEVRPIKASLFNSPKNPPAQFGGIWSKKQLKQCVPKEHDI